MSSLSDSVRVTKRRRRGGRLVVRAVDEIDAEDLTATAEKKMVLGGGDADLDELKESLARKAILGRVRAEAPEAFRPGVDATVKVVSDYDVEV
jgi:hypothetical protein